MLGKLFLAGVFTVTLCAAAFGQEYGSAAEAKAMLERAAAAVKQDKAKPLCRLPVETRAPRDCSGYSDINRDRKLIQTRSGL